MRPTGEQGQTIGGIAAQVPRALESNRPQKQEGEHQTLADRWTACQRKTVRIWSRWQCLFQLREEAGLGGGCQEEQAPSLFMVSPGNRQARFCLLFSQWRNATHAVSSTNTVELTDTHREIESFGDEALEFRTGNRRVALAIVQKPGEHLSTHFDRVAVAPL